VEAEELRRYVPGAHPADRSAGQVPKSGDRPAAERDRRGYGDPDGADLGIQSPIERNLSIALGSSGVTPLEMVTAYSTFAAGGRRPTPFFIREVQDGQGHVLERTEPKIVPAIAPETAYLTIRLMQEVLRTGTGASAARLSPNLAGKTGTTNENTDAWFIGGSPDLIAGVWVGFDTPASLGSRQTAASVALPIWAQFMGRALSHIPDREFPAPAGSPSPASIRRREKPSRREAARG